MYNDINMYHSNNKYNDYAMFGLYDLQYNDPESVEEYLKTIQIPEDYVFTKEINKLKLASGDAIFINDDHVTALEEHALYFYDICKFIQDGGKIEPVYSDEDLLDMAKSNLKSDIDNLANLNTYKPVTYKGKQFASDPRSRDALANAISTYRERLPIDDAGTLEEGLSDDPVANQALTSKLPLPADYQWIATDNERVPFKMSDILQLSALFQEKTYKCTFKAREFKDRLIGIKNIEELKELKKEVDNYNWS